jgi:diguanylate cyclase (GGDEF)-like protein/PAS domain S-box-containing protein
MQGLNHLSKIELLDLVRALERRLAQLETGAEQARGAQLGADFIYAHALLVLGNSGIPAFIYDRGSDAQGREFCLVDVNPSMVTLSGYTREELVSMSVTSLLAQHDREGLRRLLGNQRTGGFTSSGWRHRTRSGEIREVEVSGYDLEYRGRRSRLVIVQDVTRRKREQLTQQRLASIVQNSHDAIIATSVDGIVLSWNRAAEQLFGYDTAEMIGRSIDPLYPREIAAQEKASTRPRVLAGEAVDSRETVRLHKNGDRIDVSISLAPLRDASGAIVGVSSITRDIRAHKEAERKLAQSHERLRALAALSYDWCWEQDEDLRFTYHSAEFSSYRESIRRSAIGRTRFELPIQWQSEQQRAEHAAALAQRKPFKDLKYRVQDASGREYHLTVSGEPIFDTAGRFKGYRGIGRDITEKETQEERLRLLSAIVGSSDDAIMSWSVSGTLLSWNPGATQMLGYLEADVLGKSVGMLMPAENSEWEETTRRVAAGGKVQNQQSVRRHRNGTIIPVAVTCSAIRGVDGQILATSCVARDIRRQKLQEHLVSENYQRLRLALDSAALSLWDWDIAASRVHYDEAFAKLLGYKPGELPEDRRPWETLLHPEDASAVSERIDAYLQSSSGACELEFRARSQSGKWMWLGARGRVVMRGPAGGALRMMGICQEISERKRAQHVGQMLSAFLEASDDVIMSRTLDGVILSWNRGAQRVLGYSPDEVIGRNMRLLVPAERIDQIAQITEIVRGGGTVSDEDTVRCHKNGRDVHLSLAAAPLRDAEGKVIGVASIGRDISQRIRLDAERSLLAAVVESSHDAIVSLGLECTIRSWNRSAELMFGYSAAEAVGRHYRMLLTTEALEHFRARRPRLQRGEAIAPFETLIRRKDGGFVLVSVAAAALREADGEIAGVAAVLRNIGSQKRLELLLARTQAIGKVGGWELDCRSLRLFWTSETYRIHGLDAEQHAPSLAQSLNFFTPEAQPQMRSAVHRAIELGESFDLELPLTAASGRQVWVRAIGEAQRENGNVTRVYGTLQDVTARRESEEALRRSERQLDSILDNAAEGIVVLSQGGSIQRINRHAQRMFGYEAAEALGMDFRQLAVQLSFDTARHQEPPEAWTRRLLGSYREMTGRRKDGTMFPLEVALSEIEMSVGSNRLTAVVRDITERKSWESRIYSLAYSDSLTGLPNRLLLRDRLEHAIAAAQRNRTLVGVLFLDLDQFKAINDSYGHHTGDQLLRDIGERTRGCVREIDTVSRLGGDEFVVVLPDLHDRQDAGTIARKILSAVAQPYRIETHEVAVTPTLGISVYPQDGLDAETLLRNSDTAMYHAKEGGKNRFEYFHP